MSVNGCRLPRSGVHICTSSQTASMITPADEYRRPCRDPPIEDGRVTGSGD
jgi:hypothetical protein